MNASTTKASPDRRTMVQVVNSVGENMTCAASAYDTNKERADHGATI